MSREKHRILLVDDDEATLFGYRKSLTKSGYSVVDAASLCDARKCVASEDFDAALLDLRLPDGNALDWIPELKQKYPDLPVIVITGTEDVPTAVKAIQSGAENYLTKPVEIDKLEMCLRTALELGDLRRQKRIVRRLDKKIDPFFGTHRQSHDLQNQLALATGSDAVVLFLGETGTGKGVLARWVHEHSSRASEAFVELNCSCLKGDLLRSELYGHAKGSFTSAVADREGLIEVANMGTLFLDEIGDMDLEVQAKLLKTIEERTFRRIGETRVRKSDFRLICATNKDLLEETEKGTFRKDLYYRICVLPILIPPLRDRPEDVDGLVAHLLDTLGFPGGGPPADTARHLRSYPWPGNIREMRNILERATLLARGGPLTAECFPGLATAATAEASPLLQANLHAVELDYLNKVLSSMGGNKVEASKMLGISLATLYRKLGRMPSAVDANQKSAVPA